MAKNFKVALVQFEIAQHNPKKNLGKMQQFVETAADKGCQLIVFPEDCITGPLIDRLDLADTQGDYVELFQQVAVRNKIAIVPGSIIEVHKGGLYNTTYYIDELGAIKGQYRKINLWHPERRYLTPGNEICVFNTPYGKIGLTICWDLVFPEIFRKMLLKGANIVVCPSYWTFEDASRVGTDHNKNSESVLVDSFCVSRAIENNIVFLYCNAAEALKYKGISGTLLGRTQITAPFYGECASLKHNKEDMLIFEINMGVLQDAEKVYKIRKDVKNRVL